MNTKYIMNAKDPKGILGKRFIKHMNKRHKKLVKWSFSQIDIPKKSVALDIGCGGGVVIEALFRKYKCKHVDGIDTSKLSVKMSKKQNKKYLGRRCGIYLGGVSSLPFKKNSYDLVTAFETIYYWPDLQADFKEVHRVLKSGGQFLIVCEDSDPNNSKITDQIPGMKIYSEKQIKTYLKSAGFKHIHSHKKGSWICVVAKA